MKEMIGGTEARKVNEEEKVWTDREKKIKEEGRRTQLPPLEDKKGCICKGSKMEVDER